MKSVVAVSGASGSVYAVRLLESLPGEKALVMSDTARSILEAETGLSPSVLENMADASYSDNDMYAPMASGSHRYDVMFIAPCSESTVAKIANGIADTL
ncbi:MAG: aromatic acid decarboxylase, partial [Candidatus Methanomethylophilaceae archaeon]|nr:aromatic acid decarboxylase [Candidatus Methanomethylophilaceae archaeon]